MNTMKNTHYNRIEKAIRFILDHHTEQPSLAQIASQAHLSPYHFQRLFVSLAGVSPKQFLQVITTQYAKAQLQKSTTLDACLATGLSSPGRLYDHFIKIEGITPGEFKSKGLGMTFYHGCTESQFGNVFICWTTKGIHRLCFIEHETQVTNIEKTLKTEWPLAKFEPDENGALTWREKIFPSSKTPAGKTPKVNLWVKGTSFQLAVWRALINIEPGQVTTYKKIAEAIARPKAYRAAGSAIGANPIAYLIPCHRVIQQTGIFGGYRWSPERKILILGSELAKAETQ